MRQTATALIVLFLLSTSLAGCSASWAGPDPRVQESRPAQAASQPAGKPNGVPSFDYPFTLEGSSPGEGLSAQQAANLGGPLVKELCGLDLSNIPVELAYDPAGGRAFYSDRPFASYQGTATVQGRRVRYCIDARTGTLYFLEHSPYSENTGIGSPGDLTPSEREAAYEKMMAFLTKQEEGAALTHMQWDDFYVSFQDGGGAHLRYGKFENGIFVEQMEVVGPQSKPYPKTTAGLEYLPPSRPLEGFSGLDDGGSWGMTLREAYRKAAGAAKHICGADFDLCEAYAFLDNRDRESLRLYGTCVYSDGITSPPEGLVGDALSGQYFEASWSVDAETGDLSMLTVRQAHTGFPTVDFASVAQQRAQEVLSSLGVAGRLEVLELGEYSILVADPGHPGCAYDLVFNNTEGYPFLALYHRTQQDNPPAA